MSLMMVMIGRQNHGTYTTAEPSIMARAMAFATLAGDAQRGPS